MQNIVKATHQESIMSRYYLLTTLNKSLRTYHETSLCTDVPPPSEKKIDFFLREGGGLLSNVF